MISTEAMPGLAAYIASKQGITGFSQSLALEVGECGVRVIPFAPGMVDTPGIRGVAPALAPRLGLSQEQFLKTPLHQAFDGLMPAEYAGAATAYLIATLADEFHGEPVTGYTVLERAGLIQPACLPEMQSPTLSIEPTTMENILELAGKLHQVLEDTEAEFNQLPLFARPLARSGFKSKSGASIADWQRSLAALENGQPVPPDFIAQLGKLATYYRDVPKETARFTKDADLLRQVMETCEQRIAVVQALELAL
jgi:hypothetical protein